MSSPWSLSPWSLSIPTDLWEQLAAHLFPGDADEHGAVIGAGMVTTSRGVRLLARELVLAQDGVDYVPGKRGYRMLTASFVTENVLRFADDGLVYLAIHCHGGGDSVGFSGDDFASHRARVSGAPRHHRRPARRSTGVCHQCGGRRYLVA